MYSESFVTKSHISKALHVCNRYWITQFPFILSKQ